ncbi:MAG: ankyrin repeat domain-containing protein [Isosphaeraceae bacterium]
MLNIDDPRGLTEAVDQGDTLNVMIALDEHPDWLEYWDPSLIARPLHFAAGRGYADMVQELLRRGAEVNPRDYQGKTPLHWAAQGGFYEVVDALITRGADLFALDDQGWTPLVLSAMRGGEPYSRVANLLLERGARLDLLSAVNLGKFEEAKQLLAQDPKIISSTPSADLLIGSIVQQTKIAMLKYLSSQADPKSISAIVDAIDFAVSSHIDMLENLINHGAPLDRAYEALVQAIAYVPHPRLIADLLRAGANISPSPANQRVDLIRYAKRSPYAAELEQILTFFNAV